MRKIALFLILLLTIVSCKKDEPVTPDYSSIFVGTWKATTITSNGTAISVVGKTDLSLTLKITRVSDNKVEGILSSYIDGKTTKTDAETFEIVKNGDTYTLDDAAKSYNTAPNYFRYSSLTGELKLGGKDSDGDSSEAIFKK